MKRLVLWLACCGLALGTASQAAAEWQDSDFLMMVGDARPFSIWDGSLYDRKPYAPQGFAFRYSRINWLILQGPDRTIGNDNVTRFSFDGLMDFPIEEYNTANTADWEANLHGGDMLEFVYMDEHCGWSIRTTKPWGHRQEHESSDVHMKWADPLGVLPNRFIDANQDGFDDDLDGDLIFGRDGADTDIPPDFEPDVPAPVDFDDAIGFPIVFDVFRTYYRTKTWTVDINNIYRFSRLHYGGWLEGMVGVRYFNFEETFGIDGRLDPQNSRRFVLASRAALVDTKIDTEAENNVLAPQLGFRWFRKDRRITNEVSGRGGVGFNWQSVHQSYVLASRHNGRTNGLVTGFTGSGGDNTFHATELCAFAEGNYTLTYQLTSKFSLHAGGNVFAIDGIARPTNMVDYTLPRVGILGDNARDHVVMYGFQFGFDYNR